MGSVRVHRLLRPRPHATGIGAGSGRDGNPARGVADPVRLLREASVRLRTFVLLLAAAGVIALMWTLTSWKNQPVEVQFVKASRQTITSSVPTNGKVEPIEWATARAE